MKILLNIIFLLISLFINDYELINTVKVQGNNFKTDLFENVYIVNNQSIIKYNDAGAKLFTYVDNNLGYINYLDVSDPLRILVFYKDFNQLLFLDKTLSIIGSPILLDNLGFNQVDLACSSNTGGFWIYNSQTNQLILIDKNLQIKQQSISINSILQGNSKPNYLIEKNDYVYLNIPETGIIIFDKFGTYNKTVPIQKLNSFQIISNNIIYFKNNKLFNYNPTLISEKSMDIPDTLNVRNARIEQNKLFIFKEDQFSIYRENKK